MTDRYQFERATGQTPEGDSRDRPDFQFQPGEANVQFFDEEFNREGQPSGSDGTDVLRNIGKWILGELREGAKAIGENPIVYEQLFEQFEGDFWRDANEDIFRGELLIGDPQRAIFERNIGQFDPNQFLNTERGFKTLMGYARNWWAARINPELTKVWSSSGGSGRGRGSSGPTAQDIRNQFDVAQLAKQVEDMWFTYLLDEAPNPREIASEYVNEIVRTRGEKKIDFKTFVEQKIEKTPRFASIMKNKPAGMNPAQYLQPYFQRAQQVLRPDDAVAASVGGAQFGADAATFDERLRRSNEFRTSAPFMESIEGRLRSLKGVLKG